MIVPVIVPLFFSASTQCCKSRFRRLLPCLWLIDVTMTAAGSELEIVFLLLIWKLYIMSAVGSEHVVRVKKLLSFEGCVGYLKTLFFTSARKLMII